MLDSESIKISIIAAAIGLILIFTGIVEWLGWMK